MGEAISMCACGRKECKFNGVQISEALRSTSYIVLVYDGIIGNMWISSRAEGALAITTDGKSARFTPRFLLN